MKPTGLRPTRPPSLPPTRPPWTAWSLDASALAAQEKEKEQIRLARHQESLAKFPQLPHWQQKYALAKWEVIKAYEAFMAEGHFPRTVGQELFINEYNLRRVEIPEQARAIYSEVCLSSLRRSHR